MKWIIFVLIALNAKTEVPSKKRTDYKQLFKDCQGNSCCEASAKNAENGKGFVLEVKKAECPKGHHLQMLRCKDSYRWCEKISLQ